MQLYLKERKFMERYPGINLSLDRTVCRKQAAACGPAVGMGPSRTDFGLDWLGLIFGLHHNMSLELYYHYYFPIYLYILNDL